jgi:hypothetical protein
MNGQNERYGKEGKQDQRIQEQHTKPIGSERETKL